MRIRDFYLGHTYDIEYDTLSQKGITKKNAKVLAIGIADDSCLHVITFLCEGKRFDVLHKSIRNAKEVTN